MTLAEEIAADALDLAAAYPRGATTHDLAGYYGEPLAKIEAALSALRTGGVDLGFVQPEKNPEAVALGRLGGLKGGPARAAALSPTERREAGRRAAKARWNANGHPNKRARSQAEILADTLEPKLPSLVQKYPYGANSRDAADALGISLEHFYPVVTTWEAEGKVLRVSEPGGGAGKTLLVPGMLQLPPVLTPHQEAVYQEIVRLAEGADKTIVNYSKIGSAVGVAQGSVVQICSALEIKGYISRITPWQRDGMKDSPEYHVFTPVPSAPKFPKGEKVKRPPSAPRLLKQARDAKVVKRALERRAECVEEIERIDIFLATYGAMSDGE